MGYTALNAVRVPESWSNAATFESDLDIYKLDVSVKGVDVLMQCLGPDDRAFLEDETQFILLRRGFNSKPFLKPVRRYRFRQWPKSPFYKLTPIVVCEVDIVGFS